VWEALGRLWSWLFGLRCHLCGGRMGKTYTYMVNRGRGWSVCRSCIEERLAESLRNQWYYDLLCGRLLGADHFCPVCDKVTYWKYNFLKGKRTPTGAMCRGCGSTVLFD